MRRFNFVLIITLSIILYSCGPLIRTTVYENYSPINKNMPITLYELHDEVNVKHKVIGFVKVGESGIATNCDYFVVVDRAKKEARKIGGNAIKITKHKLPTTLGSTCHRIEANIIKVDEN